MLGRAEFFGDFYRKLSIENFMFSGKEGEICSIKNLN